MLSFYNNLLYKVGAIFEYKDDITVEKYVDVYSAYLKNMLKKYGSIEGAIITKIDGKRHTGYNIIANNLKVEFIAFYYITNFISIEYALTKYSTLAENAISKKENEDKKRNERMEGF